MRNVLWFLCLGLSLLVTRSASATTFGFVDQVVYKTASGGTASGWSCDIGCPDNQNIQVDIWRDDGVYLGGSKANVSREAAVGSACHSSNSAHGFSFGLVPGLLDDRWHQVHVYSYTPDNVVSELSGSPLYVYFSSSPPPGPDLTCRAPQVFCAGCDFDFCANSSAQCRRAQDACGR